MMPFWNQVYLAARYSRREELVGYRAQLNEHGIIVTGRWLNGDHQVDDAGLSTQAPRADRERFAREDLDDVRSAGTLVAFTEKPRETNSRGGRHVELGIAIGLDMTVIICGPLENVFCCLPQVKHFETWAEALPAIVDQRDRTRRGLASIA